MTNNALFDYDEEHPIPDVDVIDINTVKIGGGSDLLIVIASPLQADRRSLERLLRKVERYLEFIKSHQFRSESGDATAQNTRIVIKIHPGSDPLAFELLERNAEWIRNNDATLVIDKDDVALR